jgi:flagellar motility protein MotE (MotC chaperone)
MEITKKKIIIIVSVSLGVLLIGSLIFYFFFSSINPEKFEETVQQVEEQNALIAAENSLIVNGSNATSNTDIRTIEARYNFIIDSLEIRLNELDIEKNEYLTQKTDLVEKVKSLEDELSQLKEIKTNFEDELKGVLNLDDKQLSPIIQAMKIEKVAELYQNSNTNQKQKILRNLDPDKAAKILESVFK